MTRTNSAAEAFVVRTAEAGVYLGLTPASVRRHARSGNIPFVRVGIHYRFRLLDLESYARAVRNSRFVFADSDGPLTQKQVQRIFGNRNWRYYCPDRKPESILPALRREILKECRKEARQEWCDKLKRVKRKAEHLLKRNRRLLATLDLHG